MKASRLASSWNTDVQPSRPFAARMPQDIPIHLARLLVSYARVIVRLPPDEAAIAVRALEVVIENGRKSHEQPG